MSLKYEPASACRDFLVQAVDRLRIGWLKRGAARAEDAQGTATQSDISPSILVYEEAVSI